MLKYEEINLQNGLRWFFFVGSLNDSHKFQDAVLQLFLLPLPLRLEVAGQGSLLKGKKKSIRLNYEKAEIKSVENKTASIGFLLNFHSIRI